MFPNVDFRLSGSTSKLVKVETLISVTVSPAGTCKELPPSRRGRISFEERPQRYAVEAVSLKRPAHQPRWVCCKLHESVNDNC